jgi:hypothetical protein
MRTGTDSNTPWQKIRKFITNPTVEVVLAILVVLFSAWIVIETETGQLRSTSAFPVLFGHK